MSTLPQMYNGLKTGSLFFGRQKGHGNPEGENADVLVKRGSTPPSTRNRILPNPLSFWSSLPYFSCYPISFPPCPYPVSLPTISNLTFWALVCQNT